MAKITFNGHACVTIEDGGFRVIVDPWLSGNPVAKLKPNQVNVNAVLVTHGHFDHMTDALAIAKQCDAPIIGTAELAGFFEAQGAKTHGMHIGGSHEFPFGWIKLTQAWHGSAVTTDQGTIYTGSPCGFLVKLGDKLIYHAGDTGLFSDMKLIGSMNKIDLALLPIGDNYVMGPDDAAVAAEYVAAKITVPMHYNTFPLIEQNPARFKDLVENKQSSSVVILEPGDTFEF